jgi:hypothetical protein
MEAICSFLNVGRIHHITWRYSEEVNNLHFSYTWMFSSGDAASSYDLLLNVRQRAEQGYLNVRVLRDARDVERQAIIIRSISSEHFHYCT